MRKLLALLLSLALLAGSLALAAQAADADVSRPVGTIAGGGAYGLHWFAGAESTAKAVIGGREYAAGGTPFKENHAYSVMAEDLEPGRTYTYQIGDFEGVFKTDPGRGTPVHFIATGDVQAGNADSFAYAAKAVNAAWDAFPDADFYVNLGDFTNDSDNEQWDLYFDAFRDIHAKGALVPVAGNHDGNLKWNWFRNMFTLREQYNITNLTGVYYSFDYGDAHFAVLNTNDMYPISRAQRNWLLNDMSQTDAKWKIVLMHRAPYSAGKNGWKPDNAALRRALLPIFDELEIDLVLCGHDHHYYRSVPVKNDQPDPDGTVYIMPSAVSTKRYNVNDDILPAVRDAAALSEQPGVPVYTHIAMDGDSLVYRAYTYDPETERSADYDSLTLTKPGSAAPDPNYRPKTTSLLLTAPLNLFDLVRYLSEVLLIDYLSTLLPQWIRG